MFPVDGPYVLPYLLHEQRHEEVRHLTAGVSYKGTSGLFVKIKDLGSRIIYF